VPLKAIDFKKLPIDEHVRLYTVLSNANRIRILFALYHNPPSQEMMLSFSRLKETLDMNPALLNHHLKILLRSELIENPLIRQGATISQYHLTKKGHKTVKGMIEDLGAREQQRE